MKFDKFRGGILGNFEWLHKKSWQLCIQIISVETKCDKVLLECCWVVEDLIWFNGQQYLSDVSSLWYWIHNHYGRSWACCKEHINFCACNLLFYFFFIRFLVIAHRLLLLSRWNFHTMLSLMVLQLMIAEYLVLSSCLLHTAYL